MASYILAKDIFFDGAQMRPGIIIDEDVFDISRLRLAGGRLIPLPNPVIEEYAKKVREQQFKGRKGYEVDVLLAAYSLYAEQAASSSSQERYDVELLGIKDGINALFNIPEKVQPISFRLYLNGVRLHHGVSHDFVLQESVVTQGFDRVLFLKAKLPLSFDEIRADYKVQ